MLRWSEEYFVKAGGVEKVEKVTSFEAAQHSTLVRGFLQRRFLNPSPTVKGSSPPSPKLPVALSSTKVVMDDWMKGAPPPLGGCTYDTIIAEKGEDFRLTELTQSQKWPVGFGSFGAIVAWDQGGEIWDGEDGGSLFPLMLTSQTRHWID